MDTIAFARGVPAPDMLPIDTLRRAVTAAFDADPAGVLSYGTGGGYLPLRQWLGQRHGVDASQVVITTGSLQGFSLLADLLRERAEREGRRPVAIVENPTYDRPLLLLQRSGWEVRSARLDHDGVSVTEIEAHLTDVVDLVYVIPTFQNPAGCTLSEERRRALLDLTEDSGALVFEDDPYGELWFDAPPPATLWGRSSRANLAYSSSFSKTISPGLRVGYVVLPPDLAALLERRANDTYISASFLGQATVLAYAQAGELERGIARSREQLAQRCSALCSAIDTHLPDATYVRPGGGYFLWLTLPQNERAADMTETAAKLGVTFVPGDAFGDGNAHALRLAFSSPAFDSIAVGVERLAEARAQLVNTR